MLRFHPQTGLIDTMEAIRYRNTGEGKSKILWICRNESRNLEAGSKIISVGSAMLLDQGKPWAYFNVEELIYNADVSTYIHQGGN